MAVQAFPRPVVREYGDDEVTLAEAAELLGVHVNTVRNRVRAKQYPSRKVPSGIGPEIIVIPRAALDLPTPPAPVPLARQVLRWALPDDPRLRKVVLSLWAGVALLYAFLLGRLWERVSIEDELAHRS